MESFLSHQIHSTIGKRLIVAKSGLADVSLMLFLSRAVSKQGAAWIIFCVESWRVLEGAPTRECVLLFSNPGREFIRA
jgi:hypothetical protein